MAYSKVKGALKKGKYLDYGRVKGAIEGGGKRTFYMDGPLGGVHI